MKRTILMTALASAVVLMFAAPSFADAGRVVGPIAYSAPSLGQGDLGGFCIGPNSGTGLDSCVEATPIAGEDEVDVTVTDAAGQPVFFSVGQDLDGDGATDTFGAGCGTITGFPIDDVGVGGSDVPVIVFPWAGPAVNPDFSTLPPTPNPCVPGSTELSGSATFTFHNHI